MSIRIQVDTQKGERNSGKHRRGSVCQDLENPRADSEGRKRESKAPGFLALPCRPCSLHLSFETPIPGGEEFSPCFPRFPPVSQVSMLKVSRKAKKPPWCKNRSTLDVPMGFVIQMSRDGRHGICA